MDSIDQELCVPNTDKEIYNKTNRKLHGNKKKNITSNEIAFYDKKVQSFLLRNNRVTKTNDSFYDMKFYSQVPNNGINAFNSVSNENFVPLIDLQSTPISRIINHQKQRHTTGSEAKSFYPNRFSFYDPDDTKAIQKPPTRTVQMSVDSFETESDVSGITTPTVFTQIRDGRVTPSRTPIEQIGYTDGKIPALKVWRNAIEKKNKNRLEIKKKSNCHLAKSLSFHNINQGY